jgi:hypothetical protein
MQSADVSFLMRSLERNLTKPVDRVLAQLFSGADCTFEFLSSSGPLGLGR